MIPCQRLQRALLLIIAFTALLFASWTLLDARVHPALALPLLLIACLSLRAGGFPFHSRPHTPLTAADAALAREMQTLVLTSAALPPHHAAALRRLQAALARDQDFLPEDYEALQLLDELWGGVGRRVGGPQPPLRPEIMAQLPSRPAGGADCAPGACCAVCLAPLLAGEDLTALPCSHAFHGPCVARWLGVSGVCPVCRMCVEQGGAVWEAGEVPA